MRYTTGEKVQRGDVVRIGKGKVEYTVRDITEDLLTVLESHNTGRLSETAVTKLALIESVEDVAYEVGCDVEELNLVLPQAAPEPVRDPIMPIRESMFSAEEEAAIMRDVDAPGVDEVTEESTSYQKAILFALNRLGKHVYGGTVVSKRNRRKVAKQARRNARRAGKARFLEISNAEQAR